MKLTIAILFTLAFIMRIVNFICFNADISYFSYCFIYTFLLIKLWKEGVKNVDK